MKLTRYTSPNVSIPELTRGIQLTMAVLLRHVDRRLKHQHAERDPPSPADEAYQAEDSKYQEDDSARPIFPAEHVYSRREPPNYVQYAGRPDELLREESRHPDVCIGEDDRHCQDKRETDNGV